MTARHWRNVIESKSVAVLRGVAAVLLLCHCSSNTPAVPSDGEGGAGGESQAGKSGGEGGVPSAGTSPGGTRSGGTGSGGDGGGSDAGGSSSSGSSGSSGTSGGQGGTTTGGDGGASGDGGSGGTGADFGPFMLGADISSLPESIDAGTTFLDTDGVEKDLVTLLGNHGFNYVRLRTFVDPSALYGYANPNGEEQYKKAESYCDTEHTLDVALRAKEAGMRFLLDLHYSDNWADPGKQMIPAAWRGATSISQLASHVKSYTASVVSELVAGGARPDMVQLGNEITPGLLIHIPGPDPDADQWGNMNKLTNTINGAAGNWNNVATLLKAGVDGVKAVDPTIKIMLHLENTNSFPAVVAWVNAVRTRGVQPDVLGLSCYPTFQGEPAVWKDTFEQLTENLNGLSFVIAEYNPRATEANRIMAGLPDGKGLGTFFWEPTQSGSWGASLFHRNGDVLEADAEAFEEFDALRGELSL